MCILTWYRYTILGGNVRSAWCSYKYLNGLYISTQSGVFSCKTDANGSRILEFRNIIFYPISVAVARGEVKTRLLVARINSPFLREFSIAVGSSYVQGLDSNLLRGSKTWPRVHRFAQKWLPFQSRQTLGKYLGPSPNLAPS